MRNGGLMAKVQYQNVGKRYLTPTGESVMAVENFTLTIENGEFVCVVGPSGCGKSTVLSMTAGLLDLSEGRILFDDKPLSKEIQKEIGVVFQDSSLFPWRTIAENVGFGMEIGGIKKEEREKKITRILNIVGLSGAGKKYPNQLSGGMKQRAGIARTLINNPQFILMDEPFSAVDYLTKMTLQDEIEDLWAREKKTVLFVTHDVREAVYLADRVVVLSARPGHIQRVFDVPIKRPRVRTNGELLSIENKIYQVLSSENRLIQ